MILLQNILIPVIYLAVGGLVLLISIAGNFILLNFRLTVKKKAPAIIPMFEAYNKNKSVLEVTEGGGVVHYYVGTKTKRYDLEFKNKDSGIKIDDIYSTISPQERYVNGVKLLRYNTSLHFPTDSRGGYGLINLIEFIRTEDFLDIFNIITDDMCLIEMICTDSEDLYLLIDGILKDYDPDYDGLNSEENETRINDFIAKIQWVKQQLPKLNIRSKPVSIAKAMSLIPSAFSAADLEKAIQLTQWKTRKEQGEQVKILTYGIAALMILGGLGAMVYLTQM